jgi:hypothetical protein
VIHARRGDTAEAEELLAAELRESEHPAERQQIIDAAEHLGLKRAREVRRHIQYDPDAPV